VRQPTLSCQTRECNFPCERHVVPDRFLTLAYAPGGVVLKWIRDQLSTSHTEFARKKNQNPYEIMLADLPDNPTRLMFFPYLLGTGTPWLNDTVQGAIWGISATTHYETIVKAALEGITYEICWNLDLLERAGITCERMHAVGGGAQSSVWLQLKADVFGREVVAVQGESSCVGAAICASIGLGLHQSWEEAAKDMITFGRTYHPRPTIHNQYREMLDRYKDLAARIYGFKSSQKGVQECEKQP
jgi:xylulokinase